MNDQKKEIVVLYLKNKKLNFSPISQQTKNLRDKTNEKIRFLGNKYYIIKNIFDKYNFKRDDLFAIAKDLENEYNNFKPNIHLQNQLRRMKEALLCWFCENFFDEIVQPNSIFLRKLIEKNKNIPTLNPVHIRKNFSKFQESTIKKKINFHTSMNLQSKTSKKVNDVDHHNDFSEYRINQEIDSFDFIDKNIDNIVDKRPDTEIDNENFNFEKFLNF